MAFTNEEIALIKGMLSRGDKQSHIAAWFGGVENSGRISEINTGMRGQGIEAASPHSLPPPGPYHISGRASLRARETLTALRDLINQTLEELDEWERGGG